jgi:hypothetical protein
MVFFPFRKRKYWRKGKSGDIVLRRMHAVVTYSLLVVQIQEMPLALLSTEYRVCLFQQNPWRRRYLRADRRMRQSDAQVAKTPDLDSVHKDPSLKSFKLK